ncbi:MAG: hypothetical protein HN742_04580 [Lentisphaerae bacterium]|jgi:hypothetical protein|nr:hypothetical protein [Lentisphaerota bacterium]MBT4821442.1 hypothetical protein [Lentisphaerota bacterium]MBT5607818.1 hypothetical protein [Lentisphaerota bacterium]MBT7057839.1 hypothetical protein [Lentisphaerota bacterium]MBT7841121.1 hypothetical protein [Lentisphaerota bacterium]
MGHAGKPIQTAPNHTTNRRGNDGTLLHEERSVWKAALVIVLIVLFAVLTNLMGLLPN